jgi:hypothetical protein
METVAERQMREYNNLLGILDESNSDNSTRELSVNSVMTSLEALVDAELFLWDNEPQLPRLERTADGSLHMSNPLEWWKTNQKRFPRLAPVALQLLSKQATSASSERLFSTAGLTISDMRSRLTPDNAAMIIFLHDNLPFVNAWRQFKNLSAI